MKRVALALLAACTDQAATSGAPLVSSPPWTAHTISAAYIGADGHALGDVDGDGDADIAIAWEQSARVSIHARPCDPRQPWPEVASYAHAGAEDVALCDLDGDGWRDVVSAGQDKKLRVAFGPTFTPTVIVAAATNAQQWLQVICGDDDGDGALELVAGGRVAYPATISAFTSATPRDGSSWTREILGPAGWTMALAIQDVDADGLADVLTSDRQYATPAPGVRDYTTTGVRYLTRVGGAWASVPLAGATGYTPRFASRLPGTGLLLWGGVDAAGTGSVVQVGGAPIPYPASAGPYQAGALADVDGDGDLDAVTSPAESLAPAGLRWFEAPGWTERAITDGGGKWDEIDLVDVDADGDLDVVSTEQVLGLGAVWLERP